MSWRLLTSNLTSVLADAQLCGAPARRGGRRREPENGEAARDEEVGDLLEREVAAGAVPVPDAVVQAQDGAGEQARVGLGDRPLFHGAREERRPGELEIARP